MNMNRRDWLKVSGGAAAAAMFCTQAFAKAKPLKVLILGGTGFIGPHFVEVLGKAGHKVTLFNRGKRDPEAKPGVEQLLGDRNGDVKSLEGRSWDVVIDNSGYTPKQVKLTADLLKPVVKQYVLISSVAVYGDFKGRNIDESYRLAELPAGEDPGVYKGEFYGALKVLAERVVEETYGKAATIIRPSYIAGPGDVTDRFTYWPFRVSKGGEMLAPGKPADPFQYIDVRDLADFVRTCVEKKVGGPYNLCVPPGFVTIGSLLETSKKFTWASKEFLEANEIIGEKAKGNFVPIWLPGESEDAGILSCASARAEKKGLRYRTLETTVRETLEWQKGRPEEKQKLRAGLTMEKEAELLAKLKAG
jgi:2'-hydroxyisoflavone reductase